MSNEKVAKIGDYVTTNNDTYEIFYSASGDIVLKHCGIRQGIFTGELLDRYDSEYPEQSPSPYYVVQGSVGKYATKDISEAVVVDLSNTTAEEKYRLWKIRNNSFHCRIAELIEEAYKAGYRNGASNYIGASDSEEDMQEAQKQDWEAKTDEFVPKIIEIQQDLLQ